MSDEQSNPHLDTVRFVPGPGYPAKLWMCVLAVLAAGVAIAAKLSGQEVPWQVGLIAWGIGSLGSGLYFLSFWWKTPKAIILSDQGLEVHRRVGTEWKMLWETVDSARWEPTTVAVTLKDGRSLKLGTIHSGLPPSQRLTMRKLIVAHLAICGIQAARAGHIPTPEDKENE